MCLYKTGVVAMDEEFYTNGIINSVVINYLSENYAKKENQL